MERVTDYSLYDRVDRFRFGDAVNLFYGFKPEPLHKTSLIEQKRVLQSTLFALGVRNPRYPELELYDMDWTFRGDLMRAADSLELRPPLLYPEEREQKPDKNGGRPPHSSKEDSLPQFEDFSAVRPVWKRSTYDRCKEAFVLVDKHMTSEVNKAAAIKTAFKDADKEKFKTPEALRRACDHWIDADKERQK